MSDVVLSDDYLESHRTKPKKVKRLAKRWIQKPGRHKQKNHIVEAEDGSTYNIYVRQNMDDIQDFSCGLVLTKPKFQPISA